MPNAILRFEVSSHKLAQAVERFGEKKFWYKIFSPLILNFLPFSSHKRPPQTPQTPSQNQARASAILDFGSATKPSQSVGIGFEKRSVFQLIFLNDHENQGVEIKELDEIDYEEVRMHVEKGDSIFITRRENEKIDANSLRNETTKKTR